jgi:hypothetical protein
MHQGKSRTARVAERTRDAGMASNARWLARVGSLIAVCVLALLACALPSRAAAPANGEWLVLSDIHLDPTGRHADGSIGEDANPALLALAIETMRRVDPDPPVVVITGDFLEHSFDPKNAAATIRSIAQSFDRAFPRAQFVLALGNEDSACADYAQPPNSAFLRTVARAWEPLVNRHGAAPGFVRSFSRHGFYVVGLPGDRLRAVVIDDAYWSIRANNRCDTRGDPSGATLRDLDAALRSTRSGRALVFAHIPPGIDTFSSVKMARGLLTVPFLQARAQRSYLTILRDPKNRVAGVMSGHTHKFAFRVVDRAGDPVPIVLIPSISAFLGNAPAFLTMKVSASGAFGPIRDWTLLAGRWAERGGTATLGMPDASARSILGMQQRLQSDERLRETYALLYGGGVPPEIDRRNWRSYWCASTALSIETFRACTFERGYGVVTARGIAALAIVVVVAASILAATVVTLRRLRRRA